MKYLCLVYSDSADNSARFHADVQMLSAGPAPDPGSPAVFRGLRPDPAP